MLKQKYFLTGIFILSAERQPIKLAWRKIVWLQIILLTSLVERYNHGYMRRSIYFSYEEVLIKEAEGIIHGYLPEIDGIIYED